MIIIIMTIDADSWLFFVYSLIYLVFFTIHIPIVFRTYLYPPSSLSFPAKEKEKKERQKQTEIPPKKTTKPNH